MHLVSSPRIGGAWRVRVVSRHSDAVLPFAEELFRSIKHVTGSPMTMAPSYVAYLHPPSDSCSEYQALFPSQSMSSNPQCSASVADSGFDYSR